MSKEANLSCALNVGKRDATTGRQLINYARSQGMTIDVAGSAGPYVGTVRGTTSGTFVSLAAVGTPGAAWFHNQSSTYTAYVGTYDNSTGRFTPFLRLLPGMALPAYLPETLRDWSGTAPGTASLGSDQLMIKTSGGPADVLCEVFPE